MAKVTNLTDRTQSFLHWKVLPKSSKLIDPKGEVKETMPDHLAYSAVAKGLADQGVLELEGYVTKKSSPPTRNVFIPPAEQAVMEGTKPVDSPKKSKRSRDSE